ncbi:sugar fermentation stimulation protein [Enterococcus sp. 9D6_DIV0238]|uniref:Sugar fermentation stimulation protein homolog n=1 Tax=Candidatus Enterococcus dunnyi TaxID=1834192 RepID=A0A200J7R2_9ENTE|nr:DNA/RNA nuclease SfsA [Enterococcus sp. DIV0242_7C1]OUZ33256.1 sugar fermentation stimulation protein [Enterococcus sp. 9D6_DIV0238]
MITYPNVHLAHFIDRPNRFIATCRIQATGEIVTVHVKNTGRCKELFYPEVEVALSYQPSPKRKTAYDLIAVKKQDAWFNIDSQIPNALASQAILDGTIVLPGLKGKITSIKREKRFAHSQFDILVETDTGNQAFVEVKGMTLENQKIGAFPDAPTLRGLKHVTELIEALKEGYQSYVLFVVQFQNIQEATIHTMMQPALAKMILLGQTQGLSVIAYNCLVTPDTIAVAHQVPFDVMKKFEDPNSER